ncbi:HPr kinase/phosphorylase [Oharaeibacter diazotrophicus]|uniref:HPr serine kinase-like protein n=1 Tax=Oharaeibacter diazotrophicus TaxID=1920512 RepID=A0A4R6RCM3_9HYPH|nr:serine/threonine protein kinase [Oharaeibacter diazotrophicus]TDP83447.1 HPr serine kinase-like protein [Oharaeibacter diazotrophicus]BBE72280.1 HPr kinase/phosphorylase [Pleomorphomonas sp. SM30]GLS79050.1 hypothetical protein GCM10007904_43870 [Oharaeibacter diazotrophicus]
MSAPPALEPTVHAGAILIGDVGILIRGPSGSGKSALALALIERARQRGRLGALVADDRVILAVHGGRLVARAPATIAGLVERRGRGIEARDHEPACVVRLVVDLVETVERMPEPDAFATAILGVALARQPVPARSLAVAVPLVEAAISPDPRRPQRETALQHGTEKLLRSQRDW